MKVISTNIGQPTAIEWNGKQEFTGIFKYPVAHPLLLQAEAVAKDTIANRKVHGGIYKACYLFSADEYPYWQKKYPQLKWDWGMFGENITVEGLNEDKICIGNIYKIGSAVVQVTQPREPCYKLGIRFGNQGMLNDFIDHGHPGMYVRLVREGHVTAGDGIKLVGKSTNSLTVGQFYRLLYDREKNPKHLKLALDNEAIPERKRNKLKRFE